MSPNYSSHSGLHCDTRMADPKARIGFAIKQKKKPLAPTFTLDDEIDEVARAEDEENAWRRRQVRRCPRFISLGARLVVPGASPVEHWIIIEIPLLRIPVDMNRSSSCSTTPGSPCRCKRRGLYLLRLNVGTKHLLDSTRQSADTQARQHGMQCCAFYHRMHSLETIGHLRLGLHTI